MFKKLFFTAAAAAAVSVLLAGVAWADPTPDNHVETTFLPDGTGTLMTMRMALPDAETRAAMLATGMEHGMEDSYARLETIIP